MRRFAIAAYQYLLQRKTAPTILEDLVQEMCVEKLTLGRRTLHFHYLALHALDRLDPRVHPTPGSPKVRRSQRELPGGAAGTGTYDTPPPDVLLWQSIDRLPAWHGVSLGTLLRQHCIEGWSQAELAAAHSVTESRMSQVFSTALARLRQWLEEVP